MKPPLTYISGPYTTPDPALGTRNACLVGSFVWELGGTPLVPHTSHLWHLITPHSWSDWIDLDLSYLQHCTTLLRITGPSTGADREVEAAKSLNLPILTHPDDYLELHAKEAKQTRSLAWTTALRYLMRMSNHPWADWAYIQLSKAAFTPKKGTPTCPERKTQPDDSHMIQVQS